MFARVLAAVVVLAAAIGLLIAAWPQLFGLQVAPGIAQVVALRGAAAAVALVLVVALLLVALVSRRARRFAASLALVVLVFALLNAAVIVTRGVGDTAFETKGASDLTVLTWNTLGDVPGAEVIADLIIETDADIVSLPETTRETGIAIANLMRTADKPMWVYTSFYDVVSKARSTTLLVSADLGEYNFDEGARTTSVLPSVVATPADGSGPVIVAVHSVAPIPGQMQNWRDDLDWLSAACEGENVIMAGDFNSTLDHYAGLSDSTEATIGDCVDAGSLSDNAGVGTWPTSIPALAGAPIDHVMQTDNWRVSGMRVIGTHDGYGSDHRPVLVQLSPAA